jgi:hypothetical protein
MSRISRYRLMSGSEWMTSAATAATMATLTSVLSIP